MEEVRSYCRVCAALCGTVVTVQDAGVVSHVRGDPEHPVSAGYTCPKGRALPEWHHGPARLDVPEMPAGSPSRWEPVLDDLATRLQSVLDRHGPEGVAVYHASGLAFDVNGRRTLDRFVRALRTKQLYSSMSIDTPARPLAAELMGGWSGLTPLWDEERCGLLLLIGGNPVVSHGQAQVLSSPRTRLRAQAERGQLWVVDPRRTETARLATRHLPARPGSDFALVGFLVRELLRDGADEEFLFAHAEGAQQLAAAVEWLDGDRAAALTGLVRSDLEQLLAAVRASGRIAVATGTGTTMSRAANVTEWLVWALNVVTGSYDRPGGMWFNPGYIVRADTRSIPVAPPEGSTEPGPASRPAQLGRFGERPCSVLVPEIEAGNVRALLVLGGNPARAFADGARTRSALAALEVLAVADVVATATTELATHVLPTTGQLEREDVPYLLDTFQPAVMSHWTPAVVPPAAERRHTWWVLAQLARRLGHDVLPEGLTPETATDAALLAPLLGRSVDGDRLLTSPTAVVASGPVYGWVTDRVLPDRRWRLAPAPLVAQLAELRDETPAPLVLTPRRQLRVMNSQFQDVSAAGAPLPTAEILLHPDDAALSGVEDGRRVRVTSRHGWTEGIARVDDEIRRGAVSIPHSWGQPDVSQLTSTDEDVDPLTGMVLFSGVPVTVAPAD